MEKISFLIFFSSVISFPIPFPLLLLFDDLEPIYFGCNADGELHTR